jgi:hypothetical protein
MIEYITIGKITENCKSLIIYSGDYSSTDTIEFNFSITAKKILGLDNSFSCDVEDEVFKPNSKVLSKISDYVRPHGLDLPTNSIYNGFNLLIHKKDSFSQKFSIIDSVGGAFQNQNFQYNGLNYLRRCVEINDEFIEENICIKLIN